jgi:autotransporter-associated beta strand protein
LGIFVDNTGIQDTIDVAGTARVGIGFEFNAGTAANGFTIMSTFAGGGPGLFPRAGGSVNGIVNNDTATATINVPIKLTSNSGIAGAAAAMVFNAASGNIILNGTNTPNSGALWTINLDGASNLTFTGSANITVGSVGGGAIVNTNTVNNGGLIKNGTGTLSLGGTLANTFIGTNFINQGTLITAKANALGAGNALVLGGGTLKNGTGLSQSLGALSLTANSTIDMGSGTTTISFADSSMMSWGANSLDILDWTSGDHLTFGSSGSALTAGQLAEINFGDLPGDPGAQIDGLGNVTPIIATPEPSTLALGLMGGLTALASAMRRRHVK